MTLGERLYKKGLNGSHDLGRLNIDERYHWEGEGEEEHEVIDGYVLGINTHLCDYKSTDNIKDFAQLRELAEEWIARGKALLILLEEHKGESLFMPEKDDD